MVRVLLLACSLFLLLCGVGWSKTYSCRDASGQLHFTDNLQGLPEECLGKEQLVEETAPDNLNYVPPVETPAGSGVRFEQNVQAAERELQQKQRQQQNFRYRAESLLQRYQQATREKRKARRNWSYSSRETIQGADREIAAVRAEKRQLQEELQQGVLREREKEEIEAILAGITAE